MTIDGYIAIAKKYFLFILFWIIFVTTMAFGINTWLLHTNPKYVSFVDATLIPTSGQMEFAKGVAGGTRENQGRALVKTVRELLLSDPVVNRAIEISEVETLHKDLDTGQQEDNSGLIKKVLVLAGKITDFLKGIYRFLNIGTFEQRFSKSDELKKIKNALKVHTVDGSFILRVEATLPSPGYSAAFANSLIASYNEFVRARERQGNTDKKKNLQNQITRNSQIISELDKKELELRTQLGLISSDDVKASLVRSLELERQSRSTDMVEREQLRRRLINYKNRLATENQRLKLQQLNDEAEIIKSRIQELSLAINLRADIISNLKNNIDSLEVKERSLDEIRREKEIETQKSERLTQALVVLEIIGSQDNPAKLSVLNPAHQPPYPSSPKVIPNTILAGVVSAALSVFFVIGFGAISRSVISFADLQQVAGDLAIMSIPKSLIREAAYRFPDDQVDLKKDLSISKVSIETPVNFGFLNGRNIVLTGFCDDSTLSGISLIVRELLKQSVSDKEEAIVPINERYVSSSSKMPMELVASDMSSNFQRSTGTGIEVKCKSLMSEELQCDQTRSKFDYILFAVDCGKTRSEQLEKYYRIYQNSKNTKVYYLLANA